MRLFFSSVFLLSFVSFAFSQKTESPDSTWKQIYRASAPRINDLVHTRLQVKFDYEKSYMHGKAWITLRPHFYPTDSLLLDAKGMDIRQVGLQNGKTVTNLKYTYDGMQLNVKLDKSYKGGDSYIIYIDYTAKPNEITVKGSAAINDAKGLYFINPKGEDKDMPTQIWTQGETEATSVWCPTIDKPNQKSTQEMYMTVPAKYVTLSNGRLVSSKKNPDGTRTDYWNMELPHAPYLFFMGVGDYAIVKDSYKGKEVSYYVEKEYAPVARKIFGNTPEMMAYFSKITGVDYPWVKYSQMVARNYVSGAMENTTATLHQENAQQDARELKDGNRWESTIAHELFHQWFGDLVTAESWSNLTLNESFANYSEALWNEYKYGKDAGAEDNYNSMQGYLNSQNQTKDLVRFRYSDKEDMFDRVSYNKGGNILHMLRNYLGDSAFFKGLNVYLTTNKFKSAEAHQLRLAFEEVSGRDLNWFFNQWYFGEGHPKLDINYTYDDTNKKVSVLIRQLQEGTQIFQLPLAVDMYTGTGKLRHQVWLDKKEQTFTFAYQTKPDLINVDGDKTLLCEKTDHKTLENFIHQYKYAGNYVDRREAIDACVSMQDNPLAVDLLKQAVKDPFYGLRNYVLDQLDLTKSAVKQAVEAVVYEIAQNDSKPKVRARAISILGTYASKPEYKSLFAVALNDSSYSVSGAALEAISVTDNAAAFKEAVKLKNSAVKGKLGEMVTPILIQNGAEGDFDVIAANFKNLYGQAKIDAIPLFAQYLVKINELEPFKKGVELIMQLKKDLPSSQQAEGTAFLTIILREMLKGKNEALQRNTSANTQLQIDYLKEQMDFKKAM